MTNFEKLKSCQKASEMFEQVARITGSPLYKYLDLDKYMESESEDPFSIEFLKYTELRYVKLCGMGFQDAVYEKGTKEQKIAYLQEKCDLMAVVEKRHNSIFGSNYYTCIDLERKQIVKVPEESTYPYEV